MTPLRWPALVLIPAMIVGLVLADRASDSSPPARPDARAVMPAASSTDAVGSTWYCAAGTSIDGGVADHTVIVSNPTGREARGHLSVFRSDGPGASGAVGSDPIVVPVEVAPYTQLVQRVADIDGARAPFTAVLVEVDAGGVVVERQLSGPDGLDRGPCASRSSPTWYFAAGTTRAGARELVVLFNPFPANAVVDLSFVTDEGIRTPQAFDGVVVPAGSVVPLDITDVVTLFQAVSTTVSARAGRLVVDRVLVLGEQGASPDAPLLVGLDTEVGAPRPSSEWVFASGGSGLEGDSVAIVVHNPGEVEAEVDVDVRLDQPDLHGVVEPFELTVPAGQRVTVVLAGDSVPVAETGVVDGRSRIPVGVGFWVGVQSFNELPVVVERVVTRAVDGAAGAPAGITVSSGSTVLATRWLSSMIGSESLTDELVVINPAGDGIARVTISQARDGATGPVGSLTEVEVPARQRVVLPVGELAGRVTTAIVVDATEPVSVERVVVGRAAGVVAVGPAVPVLGTESEPGLTPFG